MASRLHYRWYGWADWSGRYPVYQWRSWLEYWSSASQHCLMPWTARIQKMARVTEWTNFMARWSSDGEEGREQVRCVAGERRGTCDCTVNSWQVYFGQSILTSDLRLWCRQHRQDVGKRFMLGDRFNIYVCACVWESRRQWSLRFPTVVVALDDLFHIKTSQLAD